MFFVYLLECGQHRYVGRTNKLKRRLREHNAGKNFSTKAFGPWEFIYFEAHKHPDDAIRREKYFKTSQGRLSLGRMLKEYNRNRNFSDQSSTTRKSE